MAQPSRDIDLSGKTLTPLTVHWEKERFWKAMIPTYEAMRSCTGARLLVLIWYILGNRLTARRFIPCSQMICLGMYYAKTHSTRAN